LSGKIQAWAKNLRPMPTTREQVMDQIAPQRRRARRWIMAGRLSGTLLSGLKRRICLAKSLPFQDSRSSQLPLVHRLGVMHDHLT
jgi:hypothetical protein